MAKRWMRWATEGGEGKVASGFPLSRWFGRFPKLWAAIREVCTITAASQAGRGKE